MIGRFRYSDRWHLPSEMGISRLVLGKGRRERSRCSVFKPLDSERSDACTIRTFLTLELWLEDLSIRVLWAPRYCRSKIKLEQHFTYPPYLAVLSSLGQNKNVNTWTRQRTIALIPRPATRKKLLLHEAIDPYLSPLRRRTFSKSCSQQSSHNRSNFPHIPQNGDPQCDITSNH